MKPAAVLLGMTVALAAPLSAQLPDSLPHDSLLDVATRLVTEGQGDSARAMVRSHLAALPPGDPQLAGWLYVAGLVASQADSALTYFRRVSIEHAQSPWAAPSLLRLAQFAFAARDYSSASQTAQRVLRDYAQSPVRAAAAYWAGRAQLELGDLPTACGLMQRAESEAGADVEIANRARFYLQRCSRGAAAGSTAASSRAGYSVQVAAVRTASAADDLMRSLKAQGFEAHAVREPDGLLKVRVGHYRTRAEAERVAGDLKQRIGGSPFIVEER